MTDKTSDIKLLEWKNINQEPGSNNCQIKYMEDQALLQLQIFF
jgi:hypothetical protein